MCINIESQYGYKLCYSIKTRKRKLIIDCITNTYGLAQFEKQQRLKTSKIRDWYILPIKNKKEYKKLWKDCLF